MRNTTKWVGGGPSLQNWQSFHHSKPAAGKQSLYNSFQSELFNIQQIRIFVLRIHQLVFSDPRKRELPAVLSVLPQYKECTKGLEFR